MKELIASQDWIPDLKKNPTARTAIQLLHSRLPSHVRQEIKIAAAVSGVDHTEAIMANFAYEVALVALAVDRLPSIPEMLRSLTTTKARPIGCTTLVSLRAEDPQAETLTNRSVDFARNLDWPDRGGVLKKTATVKTYAARNRRAMEQRGVPPTFQSVTFPGYSGVLTGFAPGRFAVAINAVMSDESPVLGAAPTFLLRRVLDECASFDEAVKVLSETPMVTSAAFTIASADQFSKSDTGAVVIERTPTRYAHRYPERVGDGHYLLATTNDMRRISTTKVPAALPGLSETTCRRYDGVFAGIPAGTPIADVLQEAEFGCTVYRARAELLSEAGLTTW